MHKTITQNISMARFAAVALALGVALASGVTAWALSQQSGLAEASAARSAGSMYLKIDGIDGESQDNKHKGEIDILSYSWGASRASSGQTGAARQRGAATMDELVLVKELGKSSPKLAEAVATGKVLPSVVFTAVEFGTELTKAPEPIAYLTYKLKNVMVTSYQTGGSAGEWPTEQISLNFEEINVEYRALDGSLHDFSWNVSEAR